MALLESIGFVMMRKQEDLTQVMGQIVAGTHLVHSELENLKMVFAVSLLLRMNAPTTDVAGVEVRNGHYMVYVKDETKTFF